MVGVREFALANCVHQWLHWFSVPVGLPVDGRGPSLVHRLGWQVAGVPVELGTDVQRRFSASKGLLVALAKPCR